MFKTLRKMILPIIIIVLLFFAGMIVLEWGAGLSSRANYQDANLAGTINGEEISWQSYQLVFNNLYQTEQAKTDDELSETLVSQLRQRAWSQLVSERLLTQKTAEYGITVSGDELYSYLRVSPPSDLQEASAFQTDGSFDYQKYLQAMTDPQWSSFWRSIEPGVKTQIARLKLQEMIVQSAQITESEVRDAFLATNEKIKVDYLNISHNTYRQSLGVPSDEELKAYYDGHTEKYSVDERAVVEYVQLPIEASENDWNEGQRDITRLYDSVIAGADFAELARTNSEDGSAPDGGDLGYFGRGNMVTEFDSLSFALKKGDISEPFRTRFGWHFIKHFGFKTEDDEKKAKVSHILLKVKPTVRTTEEISARLEQFRSAALTSGFEAAGEEHSLEVKRSPAFARGLPITGLGTETALNNLAFEGNIGDITEVRIGQMGYYIARVAERLSAGTAPFEEVKIRVSSDWSQDKLTAMCNDTAAAIYAEIDAGTSLKDAGDRHGIAITNSGEITRNSYMSGVGRDPRAVGAAFSISETGQFSKPADYGRGQVIFELLEKSTVDLTEFNEAHDSISGAILIKKQQNLYSDWFDNYYSSAEIINNVDRIEVADTTM